MNPLSVADNTATVDVYADGKATYDNGGAGLTVDEQTNDVVLKMEGTTAAARQQRTSQAEKQRRWQGLKRKQQRKS